MSSHQSRLHRRIIGVTPDTAYANAGFIEGAAAYPARWAAAAHSFRAMMRRAGRLRQNLPYDPGEPGARHLLDLFLPKSTPRGLLVFFHGGYWRAFSKDDWSHLTAGAVARGWAVAMPSYTLAPEARISEITREAAGAIEAAAVEIPGPIVLCGHSAGAHLVARMNCCDVTLPDDVATRLKRIVAISPLSDLRPLLQTAMNADFRLDMDEAIAESPLLHHSRRGIKTHVWVGAEERPAFLDQARWLADSWVEARLHIAAGRQHFDVLDVLEKPDSPLLKIITG